jgi:alpha-tubulin suppressor-like RCC1 family protein
MKLKLLLVLVAACGIVHASGASTSTLSDKATPAASGQVTTSWETGSEGPYTVSGLPAQISVVQASNYGGLVIDSAGNVYSWQHHSSEPTGSMVAVPKDVVSVGEGFDFGVAVTSGGNLWGWGNDSAGQLCNGTTGKNVSPSHSNDVYNIVSASGGADHLMLLTNSGTVQECGSARDGELGDGSFSGNQKTPVTVKGLPTITAISSGNDDSVALDSSGRVWDWGANNLGQLGDGNTSDSAVPVEVSLPAQAVQIFSGGDSKKDGSEIALLSNGEVWAWGDDVDGELGDGGSGYSDRPVEVQGLSGDIVAVATDAYSSYALESSGEVWTWGSVDGAPSPKPKELAGLYSQISAVAGTFVGLDQ